MATFRCLSSGHLMEVRQTHKHTVMCLHYQKRLHSSRMRTVRALTVSPSMLCARGGVPGPRGLYLVWGCTSSWGDRCTWSQGGCTWSQGGVPGLGGVYLVPGGTWSQGCTWSGDTWSQGLYLVPGGVPDPGGICLVPGVVYLVWWGGCIPGLVGGVYLVPGGVPDPRGVPGPGGCTWSWGGVPGQVLPPVDRITDACKNITLPQLCCGR